MSTPTFAVKLYKGEPLQKDYYPVVLQVSYKKIDSDRTTSSRIRLGLKAKERQWDYDSDEFLHDEKQNIFLRDRLARAERVYDRFFAGREFDYPLFAKRFRESLNKTFTEVMDMYVEYLIGKGAKTGTITYYDVTVRSSVDRYSKGTLPIKNITPDWLEGYGKEYKSAAYFRGLRAVIKFARKKGYIEIKDYPFESDLTPDGYSFKHLNNKKDKEPEIALTEEEIELLKAYKCNGRERKAWDTFMLSYYLFGTNLWDFMHFTDANKRGDGIAYTRSKTGVVVRMPLKHEAIEIIERYRQEKNWFPVVDLSLSEKERKRKQANYRRSVNRTLKNIARKIGIDDRIKFYTARHTAATIAIKKGAPIQEVSALLGHKTILTTQKYLAQFNVKELSGTMSLL